MRPFVLRFRAARVPLVLFSALALFAVPVAAQDALEILPWQERQTDPPGIPARDDPAARSPRAVVSVGAYVSVQVNVDALQQNIVGDAANEPSIAVNPTNPDNMVIGWRQFDTIASSFREAGFAYTFDGGATWTFPGVLENGVFRSDPVLAFDRFGNCYYQSLQTTTSIHLFTSTDGGVNWSAPVAMFGGDKNWLAVDNSGGIGDGHIYGTWQRFFSCCDPDTFTRSTNGGTSFETPVFVDRSPLFGTMEVGPSGEVYVSGIDGTVGQDFSTIVCAVSTNAEDSAATPTFSGTTIAMGGSMPFGGGPNPGGLLGQVNVSIDDSTTASQGNAYVLAVIDTNPPFSGPEATDLHISRSVDGGATWSAPVRINDDAQGDGDYRWFGAHDVAPDGRIDVVWLDTRTNGQTNISELFYSYSYDQGDTWAPNVPVSPSFDSFLGWPQQNKLGDYITLVSNATGADVTYPATFNGEQDVYYLRVFPDCDGNGVSDVTDVASGDLFDCDGNGLGDACEAALGIGTDTNTNGIPDACEADWADLRNGLAGQAGVPALAGSSLLGDSSPTALFLTDARPATTATLVLGLSQIDAPFKGGVLVPAPNFLLPGLPTGTGSLEITFDWFDPAPSGVDVFFQYWIVDAAGFAGFSASNAVRASTP